MKGHLTPVTRVPKQAKLYYGYWATDKYAEIDRYTLKYILLDNVKKVKVEVYKRELYRDA